MNQELLHKLFDYKDGKLHWKESPSRNVKAGDVAGSLDSRGYFKTRINGKYYRNHRLIFLYHHGFTPSVIDHIDGDISNNKITNLRAATNTQNQFNSKKRSDNTSGVKGVLWSKRLQKWFVQIKVDGKQKYCGSYSSIEEAIRVAKEMRRQYHAEFARS